MKQPARPPSDEPGSAPAWNIGIESVFRKLIRALIGQVSLVRLREMISSIYVEESETYLRQENPDVPPALAQLSLLTGLDTRSIAKIRKSSSFRNSITEDPSFLRNRTPTTHLLDLWSTDPTFQETGADKPKRLKLTGPVDSIEQLMKSAGISRGVTAKSISDRLLRSGAIKVCEPSGEFELITGKFLPAPDKDMEGALEVGFSAITRLIDTVVKNSLCQKTKNQRLFQRAFWTNKLPPDHHETLKRQLQDLMEQFEADGTRLLIRQEEKTEAPGQMTAGFGLYYFEDDDEVDAALSDGESSK